VFTLPLLLAIAARVIDGGNLFVQRQSVRNAADAAVLAAGVKLNADGSACTGPDTTSRTCAYKVRSAAEDYSSRNGGPGSILFCADSAATNCYVTPYKGDNGRVGSAAFVIDQDPQGTWNNGNGGNHFPEGPLHHFHRDRRRRRRGSGGGGSYFGVLALNLFE
jgi:hypothetical protein